MFVWVLVLAALRLLVVPEEHCPDIDEAALRSAATRTVAWAERTQRDDGRWIYRYDAVNDIDLDIYEMVRHSALALSLYQAVPLGFPEALRVADRAGDYVRSRLLERDGWIAVAEQDRTQRVPSGATALWLAALVERRAITRDTTDDDLLRGMGRFLLTMVSPRGAVAESWDPATGAPDFDRPSPFFTGEVAWALAELHLALPGEGWDEPAARIVRYLATERDEAEAWFPPLPDHWGAYALDTIARWPERRGAGRAGPLEDHEVRFARRIAGLESLQVRFDSQRTDEGWSRLTRGRRALGAGVGTIGEALAQLWSVSRVEPRLAGAEATIGARAQCAAGLLVDRQIDDREARAYPRPELVEGTWLHRGVTQIDDQQHPLSGILTMIELVGGARA